MPKMTYQSIAKCPAHFAEKYALDIVYPQPHELQVDLDESFTSDHSRFFQALSFIKVLMPDLIVTHFLTMSKSGNTHATVQLSQPIQDSERLFLQVLLGSDWKRELLNYKAIFIDGKTNHQFLFEVKK